MRMTCGVTRLIKQLLHEGEIETLTHCQSRRRPAAALARCSAAGVAYLRALTMAGYTSASPGVATKSVSNQRAQICWPAFSAETLHRALAPSGLAQSSI